MNAPPPATRTARVIGDDAPGAEPPARPRRRRWWLAIVVVLAAGAAGGVLYLQRGRFAELPEVPAVNLDGADPQLVILVQAAQEAAQQSPHSAEAWGALAMILHANGFSEAAHVAYDAARQLEPDNPQWPDLKGCLHQDGPGGPAAAFPCFDRAARLSPPQAPVHVRLANNLLELGRLAEAERKYRQLQRIDQTQPYAHLGLAKLSIVRNQFPEALEYLERVTDHPAVRHEACAIRASVYERLHDAPAADRERDRLTNLPGDPLRLDDPLVLVHEREVGVDQGLRTMESLLQAGRIGPAVELSQELVRRYPNSVEAWAALASACGGLGNLAEAERAGERCVELAPKSADFRFNLGYIQLLQKRYQDAADTLQRAIELNPRNGLAYFAQGECQRAMNDPAAAAAAYREAQRYLPDDPQIQQRLEALSEKP